MLAQGQVEILCDFYLVFVRVVGLSCSVLEGWLEVVLQDVLAGKHASISRWMLAFCLCVFTF